MPKARAIFTQRLPKLPLFTTRILSPGEKRFWSAPSNAPVPLAAYVKTSFSVRNTRFRFSFTRVNTSPNARVGGGMSGTPPAADTSGGIGVGPGDIKRYLFIMVLKASSRATNKSYLFYTIARNGYILAQSAYNLLLS